MKSAYVPGLGVAALALRAATRTYPARFRRQFATEMQWAFEARCTDSWQQRGALGLSSAISRSLVDVVRAGLGERFARRGASSNRSMPRRDPQEPGNLINSTLQDVRFAIRLLRKNPGFTLVAVLTLALGIGANTAIFTLIDALIGRPLPGIEAPENLFAMYTSDDGGSAGVSAYADYRDFAEQLETVAGLAAYKPREANLSADGTTEQISSMMVTGNYFEVLGVAPTLGRVIGPADDVAPDGHPVAVISHGLWQRRFAADPAAVGSDIRVNGRAFRIIGVTPPGFRGTWIESGPDLFVPMAMQAHMMPGNGNLLEQRGWSGVLLLGRIGEGSTAAMVAAQIETVGAWLRTNYTASSTREYQMVSFAEGTLMPQARTMVIQLGSLLGVVSGLVLLIACVNVANLLLARAAKRTREIAVRQALGAGRRRILGQLLAESLVLSGLGGIVGVGLGALLAGAIGQLPIGVSVDTSLDQRVLIFSAVVTLITGVAFGLAPARRAARLDVTHRLRDGGPSVASRQGLSSTLVVAQVAISIILLVTAGLFGRTLANLNRFDIGFDPGVVTVGMDPGLQGYSGEETALFYEQLLTEVASRPGVRGATMVNALPGPNNDNTSTFALDGYVPDDRSPSAYFNVVGPDYFEVLRIPIVAGRGITAADHGDAPGALVINAAAAARLEQLVERPALGSRLSFNGPDGPFMEVVGVVANSTTGRPGEAPRPNVYVAQAQIAGSGLSARMTLLVRGERATAALVDTALNAVRSIDPNLPVFNVGTLETHMANSLAQERLTAGAILAAALLALGLALVGLYGILACTVSRRSAEIGVRMALGADAGHLVRLVLRQATILFAIGSALGLVGAAALAGVVEGFLFEVPALDGLTYLAVLGLMLLVSLGAAWLPARRATRLDPVQALRAE